MKAELVPENGDPPIPIERDLTVIGRHPDCDIVINQHGMSKRHCVLVRTDGLLVIRDLATTNGTKVKGQRIRWAALLPDDRISLCGYKMRVYLGSDEMPSPLDYFKARGHGAAAAGPMPDPPKPRPTRVVPTGNRPLGGGFPLPSAIDIPSSESHHDAPHQEDQGFNFQIVDDDEDEIVDLS